MTTHYLIDAHTTPIADSSINDVRFNPAADTSPVNGNFVIRVSDSLDVQPETVTGLNDLLTKKYQEVLAAYPGFSNIVYDDMLDPTGVVTPPTGGMLLGDRGAIAFAPTLFAGPAEPILQTSTVVVGAAPSECIVTWEVFTITRSDPRAGRMVRSYVEEDPSTLTANITWNGGGSYNAVPDGSLFNIPGGDQGTNMFLWFTPSGPPANRLYLGSWAVIY